MGIKKILDRFYLFRIIKNLRYSCESPLTGPSIISLTQYALFDHSNIRYGIIDM